MGVEGKTRPQHIYSQREVCARVGRHGQSPVAYPNVVFFRPHHIIHWSAAIYIAIDKYGLFNKEKYSRYANDVHARNAHASRLNLLTGYRPPEDQEIEIEYLDILKSSSPLELSRADKKRLMSLKITPKLFQELSDRESDIYADVWNKPDDTPVIVARTLDFMCQLFSTDGFTHCGVQPYPLTNNVEEWTIQALAQTKKMQDVSVGVRRRIKVVPDKDDPERIFAITLPLLVMKDIDILRRVLQIARGLQDSFEEQEE